jgi:hypothetical protein
MATLLCANICVFNASVEQNAALIAQHCRIALFVRAFFPGLSKPNTGTAAVLVDELDAGQLKYPSEHSDRLRPHAKPVSYRFLGVLAAWPRTAFPAADGLDAAAASADLAVAALVKADARLIAISELDTGCLECPLANRSPFVYTLYLLKATERCHDR